MNSSTINPAKQGQDSATPPVGAVPLGFRALAAPHAFRRRGGRRDTCPAQPSPRTTAWQNKAASGTKLDAMWYAIFDDKELGIYASQELALARLLITDKEYLGFNSFEDAADYYAQQGCPWAFVANTTYSRDGAVLRSYSAGNLYNNEPDAAAAHKETEMPGTKEKSLEADNEAQRGPLIQNFEAEEISASDSRDKQEQPYEYGLASGSTAASFAMSALPPSSTIDSYKSPEGLEIALGECWVVCRRFASLQSTLWQEIFKSEDLGDAILDTWYPLWNFCQNLYDAPLDYNAKTTQSMILQCRLICQSLIKLRQTVEKKMDFALQSSLELCNHLFDQLKDQSDVVVAEKSLHMLWNFACHLFDQRTEIDESADGILSACWNVCSMFIIRSQLLTSGKELDLKYSQMALHATWTLCSRFLNNVNWFPKETAPMDPDATYNELHVAEGVDASEEGSPATTHPEDQLSPTSQDTPPKSDDNPALTPGSTEPLETPILSTIKPEDAEDLHLIRLRMLIVRAGNKAGYRQGTGKSFYDFAKNMPMNCFGPYKEHIAREFRNSILDPSAIKQSADRVAHQASIGSIARAVLWKTRNGKNLYLKDLFVLVVGYSVEDAERKEVEAGQPMKV